MLGRAWRRRPLLHKRTLLASAAAVVAVLLIGRWANQQRRGSPGQPADAPRESRALADAPLSATVEAIPGLSVAARVRIDAPHAAEVRIRHGTDTKLASQTPWWRVPAGGKLVRTIIGLTPGTLNHVEVMARDARGVVSTSAVLSVQLAAMPAKLPSVLRVVRQAPTLDGYLLLPVNSQTERGGYAVMIDRGGRVVWYRDMQRAVTVVDRLPNGHFVMHAIQPGDFEEVDLDGRLVRKWGDPSSEAGTDAHEFRRLDNGNVLVIGQEIRTVDSRSLFPGGVEKALRFDQTVTELTVDGTVAFRWSTFSHVDESEITDDPSTPFNPKDYEVAHLNSIEPTPDNGFLLSLRDMSAVVKVDRSSGKIVWRLGGKKSDFRFDGDPLGGFSRQHDARLLPNGNLLLFDNGNTHQPPESRAVEYRLDEAKKLATLVWQHRRSPPLFARIAGSARRLPNGNTLISYGPNGVVLEVDARSQPVWELKAPGGVFRALVVPSLYP